MCNGVTYQIRKDIKKMKLNVKNDMGCQKRSYRRRYDSVSRHNFIIGGISKCFIGMFLYQKDF